MTGPAEGRRKRATTLRALLACLALIAFEGGRGAGPNADTRSVAPGARRLRLAAGSAAAQDRATTAASTPPRMPSIRPMTSGCAARTRRAPSRIGQVPTYGLPAASGASDSGFNSLNRKRKKPKFYPGQAKPKPPPGPGSPPPVESKLPLRLSIPPSESANKTPLPPAMAGTVVGQPPRKRLKVDDDPFGAVGDYAGSFLIKSAVELSGGYDTNPGRLHRAEGLAVLGGRAGISRRLRLGAPRFGGRSPGIVHRLWRQPSRHRRWRGLAGADQYRPAEFHRSHRRPSRCHRRHPSDRARRGCWSATDNPGSPNIQAGLARYPVYTTFGGTFGVDQNFNRLEICGRRHRRSHRLSELHCSPTAPRRPTTTATSISMAASAASATI